MIIIGAAHTAVWQVGRLVQKSAARGVYIYNSCLQIQFQIQQILFVVKLYLIIYYIFNIYIYIFISEDSINLSGLDQFIYMNDRSYSPARFFTFHDP